MDRFGTRAFAQRHPWTDSVELLFARYNERDGTALREIVKPVEFVQVPEMEPVERGTISLPLSAAQELMDQLWVCGLRPTEGTGSAGALSAVQKHLDDMRRIAFGRFGEKP